MTRREEIEQAAMQVGGVHPDWDVLECFRIGYKEGAKWADKTMIDKACECIIKLHNWPTQYEEFARFQEEFITAFRKAMEE